MLHKRHFRVLVHAALIALFLYAGVAALRFLLSTLNTVGWSPGAFLGLLLLAGVIALIWRTAVDLRRAVRRL